MDSAVYYPFVGEIILINNKFPSESFYETYKNLKRFKSSGQSGQAANLLASFWAHVKSQIRWFMAFL